MSIYDTEKPLRTTRRTHGSMWCETCGQATGSKWTQIKIYKNGREIERQLCIECNTIQETEYYKGPTTRIKNKK